MNKNEPSNGIKCTNWGLGRQSTRLNESKVWIQQTSWAPGRETKAESPLLDCVSTLDVWLWLSGQTDVWSPHQDGGSLATNLPLVPSKSGIQGMGRPSQDQPALAHHFSIPFPANKSLCWGCYYQRTTYLSQECLHLLRQLTPNWRM